MQKINFLPQVKLWNAVEFNARPIWEKPSLGEMTYDGSANSNRFAVAVQGKSAPHWEYILTSQTPDEYAATVLRLYQNADNYVNVSAGNNGVVAVYTESLYNESTNKLATMADVQGAVAGASLLGIKMDSSILHIDDSSYVTMWSDPNSRYCDEGGSSGNNFNPLATIGTVKTAISNALAGLGDLFELKGSANTSAGGTVNGISVPSGIADFDALLNYLNGQPDGFSGMDKKGSVIIFNNEEYVLLNENAPGSSSSWELLGSITPQTCVVSLGGQSGKLLVSDSFQMADDKTLTLNPASSGVLGGVKTEHTEGEVDSSTKYEFALRLGDNGVNADKGYVSIPIITGADGDASYGIIANDTLQGLTHIYTVAINPITCASIGIAYKDIRSIQMTHNIGSEDIIVSVYKVRAGNGERQGRQLVYVDEIISGADTLLVDFGSAEAFIACQDRMNDDYLGYVIVIAAGNSIDLAPAMQGNVDQDQSVPVNQE